MPHQTRAYTIRKSRESRVVDACHRLSIIHWCEIYENVCTDLLEIMFFELSIIMVWQTFINPKPHLFQAR